MYTFTNLRTGKTHLYSSLKAAMTAKDRQDAKHGAVCTTYPKFN